MPKNQVTDPITDQAFAAISREQVLARLWEIANLSPEMTRNSITGQIKALAMIVSIEGLIPDRAQKQSAPPPLKPSPDPVPHQAQPAIPDPPPAPSPALGSNEYNFAYLSETLSASVLDQPSSQQEKRNPTSGATNHSK